ncbi:MAG: hypothetical protein WCR83_06705, partial [Candidatus Methanomethylophilaceae archaeon]
YGHDYKGWSSHIDHSCETYTYEEAANARLTAIVVIPNPNNKFKEVRNLFIQFLQSGNQYRILKIELDSKTINIIEADQNYVIPIQGETA